MDGALCKELRQVSCGVASAGQHQDSSHRRLVPGPPWEAKAGSPDTTDVLPLCCANPVAPHMQGQQGLSKGPPPGQWARQRLSLSLFPNVLGNVHMN